jgi:hypothetical protein
MSKRATGPERRKREVFIRDQEKKKRARKGDRSTKGTPFEHNVQKENRRQPSSHGVEIVS